MSRFGISTSLFRKESCKMVQASRFLLSLVSIIQDYNSLGSHAKPFYSTFNERTLTFQKKKLRGNFLDELKINVEAGHGGPGCSSFLISNRELHGKPDGGDGARGGHVYLVAVDEKIHGHSISSLDHLAAGVFKAGHGGKGGKSLCTGKSGQDLEIIVPAGTIVDVLMRKEADRNMEEENEKEYNNFMEFAQFSGLHPESFDKLLARGGPAAVKKSMKEKKHEFDLVKRELMIRHGLLKSETFELRRGQRVLIARGGNGGRGNYHLGLNNDSKEGGGVGEYVECLLRLKLVADIGLVGLPNAGKSSFLSAISNARPKIGAYPFTTLNPSLGSIERPIVKGIQGFEILQGKQDDSRRHIIIADIPGLIEGAHKNVGLGHDFLKHIEKSRVLCYVLDMTALDPFQDFSTLRKELFLFNEKVFREKPFFIIANKMDVQPRFDENLRIFRDKLQAMAANIKLSGVAANTEIPIFKVSAKFKTGLEDLVLQMDRLIPN